MMFASFGLNFSQKLANIPPRQNVGKHTPPKSGGLIVSTSRSNTNYEIAWSKYAERFPEWIRIQCPNHLKALQQFAVQKGVPILSNYFFYEGRFFILNADSFWIDTDASNLMTMQMAWNADQMDMQLLVAPKEKSVGFDGKGDFFMTQNGQLQRRGDADSAPYVYAGAIITKPNLFEVVQEDVFSLNRLFDDCISSGRLFGHVLDGLWLHVGTPAAIAEETPISA